MKHKYYILILLVILFSLVSCNKKPEITIFTSMEDFRIEPMRSALNEKFPNYNINVEYYPTGNHVSKLKAEGKSTTADISYDFDFSYATIANDIFEPLPYDGSIYVDDALIKNNNGDIIVIPEVKNSGVVAVNSKVLKEKNLPMPSSYQDLINPMYKGLISMPDPKSSGTGYMFLKMLVNTWGEEAAFEYFNELSKNIYQFTSSGSGPTNALSQGEAAIGLGMLSMVYELNREGANLEYLFFDEGVPFNYYGTGVIKKNKIKDETWEVFDYIVNEYIPIERAMCYPEKIYKKRDFNIPGYPNSFSYGDMSNNTSEEKDRLLDKWNF